MYSIFPTFSVSQLNAFSTCASSTSSALRTISSWSMCSTSTPNWSCQSCMETVELYIPRLLPPIKPYFCPFKRLTTFAHFANVTIFSRTSFSFTSPATRKWSIPSWSSPPPAASIDTIPGQSGLRGAARRNGPLPCLAAITLNTGNANTP